MKVKNKKTTINKLITNKTNIRYLSNFTGSSGFMLLTKNKKYLFTDFRYIERAKNSIKKGIEIIDITRVWRNKKELQKSWEKILKKHKIFELGIEESELTVSRFKFFKRISKIEGKTIKFSDISGEIEKIREIKTDEEIKKTIKSQRINEKVFKEIKKIIEISVGTYKSSSNPKIAEEYKIYQKFKPTEAELAWKIKELGHQFGSEDVSFDPIVAFGKNSALPHHEPGNQKLKKGDIVLIDMGMKYQGYCSDMTRMVFTAKPTKRQAEIYNLVLEAQENAIKKIKSGITGQTADEFSRKIIDKAGYKDQYGHAGGHGVGLDIHEVPALSEKYTQPLRENSIITIEPGIYLPGEFGVRIEDMVLVTKSGNQNLTKIPKKI